MSDELHFKFEVEIKSADKKQMLSKEVKEELKASGMMDEKGKLKLKGVSAKMLKRMKSEYVDCPVLKKEVQFVPCFVCPNFQSRVMGKVLCKGDNLDWLKKTRKKRKAVKQKIVKRKTKKPFGGYTINFKNRKETLEQVFGKADIPPSQMTKKLWKFVKAKRLGHK